MNQQDSPSSSHNPRHRLVGALVLLALAVIIVPMVLDFRSDYEGGIQESNLPPKPEDFHVEVLPLPVPGDAAVAPVPAPPPPMVQQRAAPPSAAAAKAAPKSVPKQVPKSASQPASGKTSVPEAKKPVPPPPAQQGQAPRPAPPTANWAVQVGSFASAKNARALRDRLQDQGFGALVDEVQVDGQPVYRVLAGPLPDKKRAEAQRRRLQSQAGLKGIVMRYEAFGR